jgi:hypothetical protein
MPAIRKNGGHALKYYYCDFELITEELAGG